MESIKGPPYPLFPTEKQLSFRKRLSPGLAAANEASYPESQANMRWPEIPDTSVFLRNLTISGKPGSGMTNHI